MKQYITLNTTYYITQYFLSPHVYKIIFFIIFSLTIREILDVSNIAYCMEEHPADKLRRPPRFTSPDAPYSDKIHFLRAEIQVRDHYIQNQIKTIHTLERALESSRLENFELSADNEIKDRWLRVYQEQNIDLAKSLNQAKMKIARLCGRITYSKAKAETIPLLSLPDKAPVLTVSKFSFFSKK